MAHTTKDKKKLLSRTRRIRGQVEALERALEGDAECEDILQLVASCRGALNGLMAELIEGHVRFHVLSPNQKSLPSQLDDWRVLYRARDHRVRSRRRDP